MSHQSRMTVKGQITVPKDIREALGLKPGAVAEFIRKPNGEVLIRRNAKASEAARRKAMRQGIEKVRGTIDTGMSTDEYMREVRGVWEP